VLADVEPNAVDFPPERADHLGDDVEEEPELPLDGRARYRGSGGYSIAQPIGPLDDHVVPQFSNHTTGGEQRWLRSAHYRSPYVKVRAM